MLSLRISLTSVLKSIIPYLSKQNFALRSQYEFKFFESKALKYSFIFPINLFGIIWAEVLSKGKIRESEMFEETPQK